jgi:ninein
MEETRIKHELNKLQEENNTLESEQTELHKQVTELYEQNIKLNREIIELEDKQKIDDYRSEKDNDEILDLINKVSSLQTENSNLRDKNDEMSVEVENSNVEIARLKNKASPAGKLNRSTGGAEEESAEAGADLDQNNSSAAIKRRGDSPSKARISEESPRLGKVRKYSNDSAAAAEAESLSGDWIALNSELGQNFQQSADNSSSGISQDYSSMGNNSLSHAEKDQEIKELKARVAELEKKSQQSGNSDTLRSETDTYVARCKELEKNLEQMAKEFENCEDYWQSKLNEERQLYEDEQRQSDEKFNELLKKMGEYEEQFAAVSEKNDGRCLSPIEEKCQLEQQYEELEAEAEEIRAHAEMVLREKAKEVCQLRLKVQSLEQRLGEVTDFIP